MPSLFDPITVGDLTLPNRVIMAPLTRNRSKQPGNIPWELNAEYYAQRSSAGLIISEASQISQQGQAYPATPGIHSDEQVEGWKIVTKAVHDHGGRIFLQLWHTGRVSHSSYQVGGGPPVAPSAIAANGNAATADGSPAPFEVPHALTIEEIAGIVQDYKKAAVRAKDAGFDGVEVHGANGYLIDQFLQDGTNQRNDEYGGSFENRYRFLDEIVNEVVEVWGAGRVGVRLSPYGHFGDMSDSNSTALFTYVLNRLSEKGIAYAHVVEPRWATPGAQDAQPSAVIQLRSAFNGVLITAGGYQRDDAVATIEEGKADAVAFGRWYISNPDLPERLKAQADLNPYDRSTFYGGGEHGYTDYPALA